MKNYKKIYSLICDDVREEKGNKRSFMGVYGEDIVFNRIPSVLPQLHFAVFIEGVKTKFSKIKIKLKFPKSEPKLVEFKDPPISGDGENTSLSIGFMAVKIEDVGEGVIELFLNDNKRPSYEHRFMIKSIEKIEAKKLAEKKKNNHR